MGEGVKLFGKGAPFGHGQRAACRLRRLPRVEYRRRNWLCHGKKEKRQVHNFFNIIL
jgi:hypothetical protein